MRPKQILVPLAGPSQFFNPDEYPFPKPLIEVAGRPMIQLVVENLRQISPDAEIIFIARNEDLIRFSLDRTLELVSDGNCRIVSLRSTTQGALCSCLMAIDHIDADAPLVIANGDQIIESNLGLAVDRFYSDGADAGVLTHKSVHPRWSYVRLDVGGKVQEAAEKRVLSRDATAGFYYFRTGSTFLEAASASILADSSVNGQFYIAPTLNEIILRGGTVLAHPLPPNSYHSFYSPAKIQEYEEERILRSIDRTTNSRASRLKVVIPAAGEGSRFRVAGYDRPKPFIDLHGRMMIEHVIDNVTPAGAEVHALLRREHIEERPELVLSFFGRGRQLHPVDALTEGTACTLLLARDVFDNDSPLLVANSDQLVDFRVDEFVKDCFDRGLDGSILVFRDKKMDPKWSFARINESGLVQEVAEKKPISDLATVGIYLFSRGDDFVRAAIDMIARNDRVNNEFYTCPVYNYMISSGLKIGIYEIDSTAMHGLGTPEDFESYKDMLSSQAAPK